MDKQKLAQSLNNIDFNYKGSIDITKDEGYCGVAVSFYKDVMKEVLAKAIQNQAIKTATLVETQEELDFNRGVIHGIMMVDEWFQQKENSLLSEESQSAQVELI